MTAVTFTFVKAEVPHLLGNPQDQCHPQILERHRGGGSYNMAV